MHEAAATPAWVLIAYLVAGICFILALRGLSSPESSRRGNRLGMAGMAIAVVTTLAINDIVSTFEIAGAQWGLELQPPLAIAAQSRGQSRTILLAGIGLTLLLAGYPYSGLRQTDVIERRVVQRTAQLSA